jgi:hypothetical protein
MKTTHGRARAWLITAAAVTGIALGAAGVAGAASGGSPSATGAPAASNAAPNPATMKNGPGETLLTGTTADKVKAAALAAVPGGTIIRVETDSAGSPYEAHVTKADGTQVTVKVDAGFKVTATEAGFGGGPGRQAPPNANPNA